MQKNLNHVLFLILDQQGRIEEVYANPIKEITLNPKEYFMHYVDKSSYDKFLQYLEHTKSHGFSFGGLINLASNHTPKELTLSFLKTADKIYVVGLIEPPESVKVLNEIIKLNNLQTMKIRTLKQEEQNLKNDSLLFEQLSQLNSDLVNTKRTLEQKNQELKRLNQKLEDLSVRDSLTKLKNRRGFFNQYENYTTSLDKVLLMIDFNHFKKVNDEYGHHRGDEALIYFAERMRDCVKDDIGDTYRLGGDEFLMFITPETYQQFLDEYDDIVESLKAYHEDLSLSYGVVEIPKDTNLTSKALKDYLKEADRLMYAMKRKIHSNNE